MALEEYPNFSTQVKNEGVKKLFIQDLEYNFMNHIASELMQKISGQYVHLYRVDRQRTKTNSYGESVQKVLMGEPVKLPALVGETVTPINDEFSIRYKKQLRVSFLQVLNIAYGVNDVFQGDFLEWQQKRYEIINISRNRKLYGQENYTFEIICTCEARE